MCAFEKNNNKIDLKYAGWVAILVMLSWFVHELAHWVTSSLIFGCESGITLNSVYPVDGSYQSQSHMIWISAAGPMVTLLVTVLAYSLLIKKGWNKFLYPFLALAVYMRGLAGLLNFISLNDEGRIGNALGIGNFTLSILITGFFGVLLFKANKQYELTKPFQWKTLGLVVLFSSILIMSDQFLKVILWVG